jgi:hypothetical protein
MNDVYFACPSCRAYVEAGYRHAYVCLEEPGIVTRTDAVDVSAVLGASEYWDVDAEWLVALLPAVRRFLEQHAAHHVRFGDFEEIPLPWYADGLFEWIMEAGFVLEELPRYYVERLGFHAWDEVVAHVSSGKAPPWWRSEGEREAGRLAFERLVAARQTKERS